MLQFHLAQEPTSLLHRLLRHITFIKSIIQSTINNLCSIVLQILDFKRASKQFRAQPFNNLRFSSNQAHQLRALSSRFFKFNLNHSSHSSLLSNSSSSSNNSRFSLLSNTRDNLKFSNRNRFSSRLHRSILKRLHSSHSSFKQYPQPKVSTPRIK